jgi:hypothetical protein
VALGLPETHFPNDYALTAPDPARRAGRPARYRRALDQYAQDGGDGLIFTSPEGTPMRSGNFTRRMWLPAIEKAGLTYVHFHELRQARKWPPTIGKPSSGQRLIWHATASKTHEDHQLAPPEWGLTCGGG